MRNTRVFAPITIITAIAVLSGIVGAVVQTAANNSTRLCTAPPGNLPKSVPEPLNSLSTSSGKVNGIPGYAVTLVYFAEWYVETHSDKDPGIYREPPPPYGKGRPYASSAVAYGPMQFQKRTYHAFRFANPNHKPGNIMDLADAAYAAGAYLKKYGKLRANSPIGDPTNPQKGTVMWALGAYNAGANGNFSNPETSAYLRRARAEYDRLFGKSGGSSSPQPAIAGTYVPAISAGNDCVLDPSPNNGDVRALINKAREFAWVKGEDPEAGSGAQKSAYNDAVRMAVRKGWHVGGAWKAGNDCQGFVNIVMRSSGYEPNWPNQTTAGLADAVARLPGWKKVGVQRGSFSTPNLRPGDVLVTPNKGHVFLFIGNVGWTKSLFVEAANPRRGPYTNGTPPSFYRYGYVVLRKVAVSGQ